MIAMIQIILTTSFALLFGGRRAVIFAAVFWSVPGFTDNLSGLRPDLHYFAALTSPILLSGFECAPGVHVVLPAIAAVAPDNAFIHVLLPFSRLLPGRGRLVSYCHYTVIECGLQCFCPGL